MANVKSIFGISALPVASPFPFFEKSVLEIEQAAKVIGKESGGDEFVSKSRQIQNNLREKLGVKNK